MKYLIIIALLAGCATEPTQQQMNQAEIKRCTEWGAPPSSANYYDCRMKINQMFMQAAIIDSGGSGYIAPPPSYSLQTPTPQTYNVSVGRANPLLTH